MNIVIHFRHFPVAMGRWFDWAFRDLGHNVWSVGCYNGGKIPWGEQFDYPDYDFPPDYEIPEMDELPLGSVLEHCPFNPDLIVQAGDTTYLSGKAPCPNLIVATDPHVINYDKRLENATHFACMQHCHLNDYPNFENKFWLPYGYKEDLHIPLESETDYDVVFIGLQYGHRVEALNAMKQAGLRVFNELGLIYEDYVKTYASGKIAFNYSSRDDLPARFWEGMAMGKVVITNRVPDLVEVEKQFGIVEGKHYFTYDSIDKAVELALQLSRSDTMRETIAKQARDKIISGEHSYKDRAELILKKCLN